MVEHGLERCTRSGALRAPQPPARIPDGLRVQYPPLQQQSLGTSLRLRACHLATDKRGTATRGYATRTPPTRHEGFSRGRFEGCWRGGAPCGGLRPPTGRVREHGVGSASALRVSPAPGAEATGRSSALPCCRCDPVVRQEESNPRRSHHG